MKCLCLLLFSYWSMLGLNPQLDQGSDCENLLKKCGLVFRIKVLRCKIQGGVVERVHKKKSPWVIIFGKVKLAFIEKNDSNIKSCFNEMLCTRHETFRGKNETKMNFNETCQRSIWCENLTFWVIGCVKLCRWRTLHFKF